VLCAILVVGFALRAFRLGWGLPEFIFNDSRIYFVLPAARAAAQGDWVLDRFVQPPIYPYALSIVTALWSSLTGATIEVSPGDPTPSMAQVALLGRLVNVALATATIAGVYCLGKRLLGTRAALWAAAFFAICPIHVLESHRINADTPMLLLAVLSSHQAVIASQERNRRKLMGSFALATLAGASKYSGLFAGTLPLWLALTWPGAAWNERARLTLGGGLVSLLTMLLAMSPVLLNWERFVAHVETLAYISLFVGSRGNDLSGDSWVYARYLYMLFVGLPHLLGWPVLLAAVAGIVWLAFAQRRALTLIAAATVPFFLLQGAAEATTTRYFLPLAPYLAVCAGGFVAACSERRATAGWLVGGLIGGYTLLLSSSQLLRIEASQVRAGAEVRELAVVNRQLARRNGLGLRRLRIAYPYWDQLKYDAIRPYISNRSTRVQYFPQYLRDAPAPRQLTDVAGWLDDNEIDAIVVPSQWEELGQRGSFSARERAFYEALTAGTLGYRLQSEHTTSFFTQSWYDWADPTVRTLWTAGISGYKIFVRDELAAAVDEAGE